MTFSRSSRVWFDLSPRNQARTIWLLIRTICRLDVTDKWSICPYRIQLSSRIPPSNGFIICPLVVIANTAPAVLWTCHKPDYFRSVRGLEGLADTAVIVVPAVGPIQAHVVRLTSTQFGRQACLSGYVRALPQCDSSLWGKEALHFGIRTWPPPCQIGH